MDQTDRKSAGLVASDLRMGTDCWHIPKSPLNFTELFSPFLAPSQSNLSSMVPFGSFQFSNPQVESPALQGLLHSRVWKKKPSPDKFGPLFSYFSTATGVHRWLGWGESQGTCIRLSCVVGFFTTLLKYDLQFSYHELHKLGHATLPLSVQFPPL